MSERIKEEVDNPKQQIWYNDALDILNDGITVYSAYDDILRNAKDTKTSAGKSVQQTTANNAVISSPTTDNIIKYLPYLLLAVVGYMIIK